MRQTHSLISPIGLIRSISPIMKFAINNKRDTQLRASL